jgi:superfamily I DNA/RNA helicase
VRQIKSRVTKEYSPRAASGKVNRANDIFSVNWRKQHDHSCRAGGHSLVLVRDRFRLAEVKRALNRDLAPYKVLGGTSPWTNKLAQEIKAGKNPDIPAEWVSFYRQADLSEPIYISLGTIHQSKGREADHVYLDLEQSMRVQANFYANPDAERRVVYVGATRCIDTLTLCGENQIL